MLAMLEHRLDDHDVLLVHTGCQFPCNQAPVLNVQPDDVWYGHVDPGTAAADRRPAPRRGVRRSSPTVCRGPPGAETTVAGNEP